MDDATAHDAVRYARAHAPRFVRDLRRFVRFPSVTADPARRADVARCAEWLRAHLADAGLQRAALLRTEGHPIVRAEWRSERALGTAPRPTLLVYGHYDVQPARASDGWHSPPFAAELRDGTVVGRGASDDKGQLLAHVKAIESWLRTAGTLPVDVVCLFEGEEEAGSGALLRRLPALAGGADVAVVSDTPMRAAGRPAIAYALRGLLSLEIDVRALRDDLHAGTFGGTTPGAAAILCDLVASLRDREGRVAVAGFHDRVRARDRGGDDDPLARPSLTVSGLAGGYDGPGGKAVIPARARAKLDVRLVPDQRPAEVAALIRRHLMRVAPRGANVTLRAHSSALPALIDPRHPAVGAAARAYTRVFGAAPSLVRAGGTIPVVGALDALGVPVVLAGFARPDDGAHAPDEHFALDAFARAIETCIHFMTELGRWGRRGRAPGRGARRGVAGPASLAHAGGAS